MASLECSLWEGRSHVYDGECKLQRWRWLKWVLSRVMHVIWKNLLRSLTLFCKQAFLFLLCNFKIMVITESKRVVMCEYAVYFSEYMGFSLSYANVITDWLSHITVSVIKANAGEISVMIYARWERFICWVYMREGGLSHNYMHACQLWVTSQNSLTESLASRFITHAFSSFLLHIITTDVIVMIIHEAFVF